VKASKTKPFKIDPKRRQRFPLAGFSKMYPVAARDAETIDSFVKQFTESLGSRKAVARIVRKG
jgi:hypothetical protein